MYVFLKITRSYFYIFINISHISSPPENVYFYTPRPITLIHYCNKLINTCVKNVEILIICFIISNFSNFEILVHYIRHNL